MSRAFFFSLYFTSFAPLWVSILFIDIKSCIENTGNLWTEIISIGCIAVFSLLCTFILIRTLCTKNSSGTSPHTLISAKEDKALTAEYLLSYILPLFIFDFTQWSQVVLFLIFFLTLGFLCIRYNYFTTNIILEIASFRAYDCILKNEDKNYIDKYVISRQRLNTCVGNTLHLKSLNNEYQLDTSQK